MAFQDEMREAVKRRAVVSVPEGDSRTKQSQRDEADVNAIMRKYLSTGLVPEYRAGQYGDFASGTDFHTALTQVREAEAAFMALPSDVRTAAKNDPGELLEMVTDPARMDEAIGLGLLPDPNPKQVSDPTRPPSRAPEPEADPPVSPGGAIPSQVEGAERVET